MAWSAKLQSGTGGTTGYNEWETVYDASTQTAYKLKYGFSLGNQAADVLYHTPDNGSPVPVQATGANRLIFLTVDVPKQANWDTVNEKVAALARLIDGPYSQAVRAQTTGDANKVRVAIKPDGATYTTYYEVLHGFMDTSQAFTESAAVLNTMARNITIALTCAPFGYGDSFILQNGLPSSPHFLIDSNADGLADGWNKSGTPTLSLSLTSLIGPYSQLVQAASAGDGVYSAQVSSLNSTAAFVWTRISSGTVVYKLRNVTDASDIVTLSLTSATIAAAADKTYVGKSGNTWYRLNLSGAVAGTKNTRIETAANGGAATYYLDAAYLAASTVSAPPAFSSGYTLTNNGVNWLDFWGIPGDVPALMRYELSGISDVALVMGKKTDGTQLASYVRYIIQDTYFANGSTWATTSNYTRASADGSVSDPYTATSGGDDGQTTAKAIAETIWKVYAVARASATDNGLYAQWTADLVNYYDTDTVTATTANTWELWDLGILNPKGIVMPTNPLDPESKSPIVSSFVYSTFGIRLVSVIPSSGTVDIDYLLLVPISEEHIVLNNTAAILAGDLRAVFALVASTTPAYFTDWRGSMWTAASGPRMTRLVYHDYNLGGVANETNPGDDLTISTTVIPRTSHLFGTK